ncbi:MAG: PilZ domain-containing protein [Endomicrobia bacterium]|nr:PilZ domain-containing protein [Endomicrobiia bacterium]MDW8055372.1 PilZ domain-containing protein [Elusimicrobiota bacterium]
METINRAKYPGPKRRKYKRLNVYHLGVPIQIKYNNDDILIPGILLNLSSGGLGILVFKKIDVGTRVNIKISLHNLFTNNIKAKVVWIKEHENTYSMGLEFIKITKRDREQIKEFVEKHLKEDM